MNKNNIYLLKSVNSIFLLLFITFIINILFITKVYAKDYNIEPTIYNDNDSQNYNITNHEKINKEVIPNYNLNIKGDFSIENTENTRINIQVNSGNLEFSLIKNNIELPDNVKINNDSREKIDNIELKSKIGYGKILIQKSKDGIHWINIEEKNDLFNNNNTHDADVIKLFKSTDIEQYNGYNFRVVVAFETKTIIEKSSIPLNLGEKVKYERFAEVYRLYVYSKEKELLFREKDNISSEKTKIWRINNNIYNAGHDTGYKENNKISKNDLHDEFSSLGNFLITGYTDSTGVDENVIFYKKPGDKINLFFELTRDINNLDGDNKIYIDNDINGYFKSKDNKEKNGYGRGTLVIRRIDNKSAKDTPTIYTNFLESNTFLGNNSIISVFEEGKYEISLLYSIKKDGTLGLGDKIEDYKMSFEFEVSNSDSNFFVFEYADNYNELDDANKLELSNNDEASKGFVIDFGGNNSIKVLVKPIEIKIIDDESGNKKYILKEKSENYANDGESYIGKGAYKIHSYNENSGIKSNEIMIYVGEGTKEKYKRATKNNETTKVESNFETEETKKEVNPIETIVEGADNKEVEKTNIIDKNSGLIYYISAISIIIFILYKKFK